MRKYGSNHAEDCADSIDPSSDFTNTSNSYSFDNYGDSEEENDIINEDIQDIELGGNSLRKSSEKPVIV